MATLKKSLKSVNAKRGFGNETDVSNARRIQGSLRL